MTARQRFDAMLRDEVWPALRERGFKGSRMRVHRAVGADWQVVAFESSKWSTRDDVDFTVELAVGLDALRDGTLDWEAERPPKEYQCHMRERLSFLLPDREAIDWWWVADGATDFDRLGRDLVAAIVGQGLPWLEARVPATAARDHLLRELRGRNYEDLVALERLLGLLGPRERLADVERELERLYQMDRAAEARAGEGPIARRPLIFTHRPGSAGGFVSRLQNRLGL